MALAPLDPPLPLPVCPEDVLLLAPAEDPPLLLPPPPWPNKAEVSEIVPNKTTARQCALLIINLKWLRETAHPHAFDAESVIFEPSDAKKCVRRPIFQIISFPQRLRFRKEQISYPVMYLKGNSPMV
jgi:hypothetical protein